MARALRTILVAALALTACGLVAAAAQAAFPGTNGKLAFTSARNGFPSDSDLHTMASDGSAQTRITSLDGDELYPSWSPDGGKLLFEHNAGSRPDVWIANADGSGAQQLTEDPAGDYHPAWSPNGAKIVFASDRDAAQGTSDLFIMNTDGSGEANITNTPAVNEDYPSWSPDGARIAFSRDGDIYTANSDGTSLAALTATPATDVEPDWSPDGNQIAFRTGYTANDEIWKMNANGTGQTNLTNNGSTVDERPSWSPAGDKIAFVRGAFNNADVYVMNPDGTSVTRLTNNAFVDGQAAWQPIPLPAPTGYARPKGAGPLKMALVPGYRPCKFPNRTHGLPLDSPSCNPPKLMSRYLTLGSPDANGQPANMFATFSARPIVGDPTTPADEADVNIHIAITDVRNRDLSDYTGNLRVRAAYRRQTDRDNNVTTGGGTDAATSTDAAWAFTANCTATASATIGSTCAYWTSIDAVTPGVIREGKRAVLQYGKIEVWDGGPDGNWQTQDNDLFLTQGVFVP